MGEYTVKALGPDTWTAFAELAERHNGLWGGCWCTWFHPACAERGQSAEGNRALKKRLVDEARARAALVFDGDVDVQAWGNFVYFRDPDGNRWSVQAIASRPNG